MKEQSTTKCAHIPCVCKVAAGKSTAAKPVGMQGAKTSKSRVNVTSPCMPPHAVAGCIGQPK